MISPTIFKKFSTVYAGATTYEEERQSLLQHTHCTTSASCHQTHSDISLYTNIPAIQGVGDAVYTDQKNIVCFVKVADCVPICMYCHHDTTPIVAAIHSGRKGIQNTIIPKTRTSIHTQFPFLEIQNVFVRIGPHISQSAYEFGPEAYDIFPSEHIKEHKHKLYVDIGRCVYTQLTALGIPSTNIECSDVCTYQSENCCSHRKNKTTQRMCVGIGMSA